MAATDEWAPPVAFYFRVTFANIKGQPSIPDTSFQEVSGLSMEMEYETLEEKGENYFVHKLPKAVKHPNLVLKRALEPLSDPLSAWVHDTIDGGFNKKIVPRMITIDLLGAEGTAGKPLASWSFSNAFPIKWEATSFHAEKNELVIETLELCYHEIHRTG